MISTRLSRTILRGLLGGGALCIAFSSSLVAQVQTSKTESHGEATKEVTVQRGEIVYINGNSVVLKMEDGMLREFDNVPESVTFIVDGQQVSIKNAKVGMKLEKQTVRTTRPKVVTTVETVTGKVWHVSPPTTVILTLENGQNQQFKIPKDQKFMVDGRETDAWGLKKGMKVAAQRITEVPETVIAEEVKRTGSAPPPPQTPTPGVPILIVQAQPAPPAPSVETAEAAPKKLPTTASDLPLIGMLGTLFCGLSLMAMTIRTIASRLASLRG
jgi:RNase P/RNase MRP subunit p29